MRNHLAWLGVAALMAVFAPSLAHAQSEPLKPYVVMILDTSGSMDAATGSGPPSCGGADSRLNHAKCAINRIVNSYGDMVFSLSRFRETPGGTYSSSCIGDCSTSGIGCSACNCDAAGGNSCSANCTPDMRSDIRLQMLTGLVDGNNELAAYLTDNACSTCAMPATGASPTAAHEIWGTGSWTPLGGSLLGAHRYWQGLQGTDGTTTIWPASAGPAGGFSPIVNDPKGLAFLPTGCDPNPMTCGGNCCASQCRPYITILLTDGDETCGGDAPTAASQLLNNTIIGNRQYRIETKAIGFGINPGDADIEAIAVAGSLAPNPVGDDGFYANDEASLQLAMSQILDDAIKTEVCNNLDDDCDITVDEGFNKGAMCNNGRLGKCLVTGLTECRADGSGTQCDAGRIAACNGQPNGTACTVTNAAMVAVPGTCQASVCQPTAAPDEIPFGCNNIDDDCDGRIDEGVTGCTCIPIGETCNMMDDDCDGNVDENLTLPCGTGVCLGTQTCNPATGMYGACSAQTPTQETCNGLDDDCDGNADGFTISCSNLTNGFPALDPLNNPGAPGHTPMSGCEMLGAQCICTPGSRTCPLNGAGVFSACTGEVTPRLEICNNLDDDCDGLVDETPPVSCTDDTQCATSPLTPTCNNPMGLPNAGTCEPADCSTNCGVGQLVCVNGMQQCNAVPSPNDDTCNNVDDDCDMLIDEDWVCADPDGIDNIPGNADDCGCSAAGQCNAVESCQNGGVVCQGDPVAQETCNCQDDNCNGQIDEGALCGAGATCTSCQCAFQCAQSEFPCPLGKTCFNNFCIADPCFNFTCPDVPGIKQLCRPKAANPSDKECVSACDPSVITCAAPNICFEPAGECRPDNCLTFPERCASDENCINGTCIRNACQGVTCPSDQYCLGGTCYGSCSGVECPDGQRCRLGACEADPCDPACPFGQYCQDDTGSCIDDPCRFTTCPQGQWCNPNKNGICEDDPCQIDNIQCADGEVCRGGTCDEPILPDAGVEEHVTTGGGGGCSTGGTRGGGLAFGLGLVWMLRRRRRPRPAARVTGGAA